MVGLHDALDFQGIKGVNNSLSFSNIKLGLTIGIGSRDGGWVG
jgi:hypothetical protein